MGSQGDIYGVYGVEVEAKVVREAGVGANPVLYSINGHTLSDEDMAGEDYEGELWNGIPTEGYGATDIWPTDAIGRLANIAGPPVPNQLELTTRILGHSGKYGGDMGARHFSMGVGGKVGAKGKALVGFVVCNECYINKSSSLPPMDDIKALAPQLVDKIKAVLGLEVSADDLGLHLLFDSIQGM